MGIGKVVLGGLAVLLVMGACNDAGEDGAALPAEASTASGIDQEAGLGGSAADVAPASTSGVGSSAVADDETGVVASVIDGDTLSLTDGRTVRVLGIDSCETVTYSGRQARADAQRLLRAGQTVSLRAEPGVDRDIYYRQLRYVSLPDGRDYGQAMIGFEHTGVYEGGDASTAYTAQLRRLDDGPRECAFLAPTTSAAPTTTTARPTPQAEPVPAPRPAPRSSPEPAAPTPAPAPSQSTGSNCHPSYTPCVPDGPGLDCGDIRKLVIVTGPDEFRLDGDDNDGRGCESYG